jgi:hypothetical protein
MTNLNNLFDNIDLLDADETDGFLYDGDDAETQDDETSYVIRGKWILDGADTLADAAEMARAYADFLEELSAQGYELRSTIDDDYGFAKLA